MIDRTAALEALAYLKGTCPATTEHGRAGWMAALTAAEASLAALPLALPESPSHHRVHRGDPDTARSAANLRPDYRRGIRGKVAEHLQRHTDGLTDDEIHDLGTGTHHRHSTATRRGELVAAGYVLDSGRRRYTPDGNEAVVWQWVGPA